MTRDWQPMIDKMLPSVRAANERVAATYGATLAEHMEVFQRQVDALHRAESYEAADDLLRQIRAEVIIAATIRQRSAEMAANKERNHAVLVAAGVVGE